MRNVLFPLLCSMAALTTPAGAITVTVPNVQIDGRGHILFNALSNMPGGGSMVVSVAGPEGHLYGFDDRSSEAYVDLHEMRTTRTPQLSATKTIWRWASVTKQVVAVLIMQEVEIGRVAIDAPATKYLPGVDLPAGDAVTVRRLLNHTSGLYDPNSGLAGPDGTPLAYLRSKTPAPKGIDRQCLKPSGRAPGEGFVYNNCDYVVLGALLEQVTGKPFATLVRERIAQPLGLASLRVLNPGDRDDIVAVDEKGATDATVDPGRYGAAANLAGTADDLLKFDRALIDGKLLGKAATAEMWKGDPKSGYAALGQWSYPVKLKGCETDQHVVERRGAVGNVQVRNLIAPERGIAIVAFAASTVPDFGEPWQGKGLTYEMLSAALCSGAAE